MHPWSHLLWRNSPSIGIVFLSSANLAQLSYGPRWLTTAEQRRMANSEYIKRALFPTRELMTASGRSVCGNMHVSGAAVFDAIGMPIVEQKCHRSQFLISQRRRCRGKADKPGHRPWLSLPAFSPCPSSFVLPESFPRPPHSRSPSSRHPYWRDLLGSGREADQRAPARHRGEE